MNKTLLGLIAALVVAVALLFVLQRSEEAEATYVASDRAFAVEDIGEVSTIRIADMQGRSLELSKRGTEWVFDDSVQVSPSIMNLVLKVVGKLKVDHLPPDGTIPMIRENLQTSAIRVASFNRDDEQLASFLIGPSTKGGKRSYALVDGAEQPYAVRAPGMGGPIRVLFDLRSKTSWKSKSYIEFDPDEIQSVEVNYPREPGESFRIARSSEGFTIDPLSELVEQPPGQPSQRLLESYFEGYSYAPALAWLDEYEAKDSLRSVTPHAEVRITERNGRVTNLKLDPSYVRNQFGELDFNAPIPSFFVDRNGTELASVQTRLIEQWFRSYREFFQTS